MAEQTITYSEAAQGWPSLYSFHPDFMSGMNNRFYTWKGGQLYIHNENELRCNFYNVQYPSTIKTVFNEFPLENKLYRTITIVGDHAWSVTNLETDLQTGGNIDVDWFEEKESNFYANIRSTNEVPANVGDYPLRSLNGIGRSSALFTTPSIYIIQFSTNPLVEIGSIISVGDYVYYAMPPNYDTPIYLGTLYSIQRNYANGVNQMLVNNISGVTPLDTTPFIMFIKNQVAESQGLLGHYAIVELENNDTEKVEMFALNAEIQKSFP